MISNLSFKHLVGGLLALALCLTLVPAAPATALAAAPKAPKALKGIALSTSSIKLTWNKVGKAKSYTLYRKSGSRYVKAAATTKNTYTVKRLKAGTRYYFKVAVKTAKGTSRQSAAISVKTKGKAAPSPTPKPTATPAPKPSATPTPTPTKRVLEIDQSLLGKWHYVSLSPSITIDFEFRADGTFEYTIVSIIYSTSNVSTRRGDYSAKNGMVYCTNVTFTDVGFKDTSAGQVETSRISGSIDDYSYAYRLGVDQDGKYMQNNYAYDPNTRKPITDESLKLR